VAEVFAGFIIGFALSVAVAPIAAIALIRSNDRTGLAQRIAPPGTNVIALSVVIHFSAFLVLTAIGMILGMLLTGINGRRPEDGLGSPNAAYTLIVVALTAALVIPTLVMPSVRRCAVAGALVFAVLFGWVMPWLAELGS
jgi:hypothetical protein